MGICLVALLLWYPVTHFDFLSYDDLTYFQYPEITNFSLTQLPAFFDKLIVGNYIPLPSISFAIEYALFGENPKVFHAFNMVLHLINTLLVWQILLRFFPFQNLLSFALALIFLCHPLQVESVSWISCRGTLLSSLFLFLCLWFYLKNKTEKPTKSNVFAYSIFFILAVFSKPNTIVIPLYFVLIDWWKGTSLAAMFRPKYIIQKLPYFLISVIMGMVVIRLTENSLNIDEPYTFFERTALFFHSFAFYFYKFILPTGFSPFHYFPKAGFGLTYYLGLPFLAALVYFIFRMKGRDRYLALFALGLIVVYLLPFTQIIPARPIFAAERYAYVPVFGLLILIGVALERLLEHKPNLKASIAIMLACALLFFAYTSRSYQKMWSNTNTLMLYGLSKLGDHPLQYTLLTILGIDALRQNEVPKALAYFELALEQEQNYPYLNNHYGLALAKNGEFEKAIRFFENINQEGQKNATLLANLAGAYTATGNHLKAIELCNQAAEIRAEFYLIYTNRGIARARLGQHTEALEDYLLSLSLRPAQPDVYYFMGFSQNILGNTNNACSSWRQAAKLGHPEAQKIVNQNCSN
jgi:tetratricopeptide (TPR) repeat protein